ncbi:hypothetical protein [Promicromonospora sp. NPDC050880]|uniref:hypothetical protein n=1 Tax=Promicromonospora sp. NPDC050880 TaxID=3364406 RepID=UPI0037BB777F
MRIRSRLVAGGASVLLLTTLLGAVGATSAEARCNGAGNGITSTMSYNGVERAREIPNSGTCNSDGEYHATLKDSYSDGNTVRFRWDGNGDGNYTTEASTGTSVGFVATDNTSAAYEQLCMVTETGTPYCGFGSNSARGWGNGGRGLNTGF